MVALFLYNMRVSSVSRPSRLSFRHLLKQQPIEELPELKSILSVQNLVAKIPEQPNPRRLIENDAYYRWIAAYCSKNSMSAKSQLDKSAFDDFMKEAGIFLLKQEEEAFQDCNKIGPMIESDLSSSEADAFVEAVKVKLSRHMCKHNEASFELMDKDKDGEVCTQDVTKLLRVAAHGNGTDWLKHQFHLYDADGDGIVNEVESKSILDCIIATQKAVMTEIFASHVDNMPKTVKKTFATTVVEEDFKSKIPEKVRCVFHFADKLDKERKNYDWELFLDSQKKEFPELHNLLAVYAKGFYDERFIFYERKREKQSTRYKGLMLATAIGMGDYVAAVI